jgi:uncharacterized protein HemY
MNHRLTTFAIMLLPALPLALRAQEPSLEKLRQNLAAHYVEAEPHMALARFISRAHWPKAKEYLQQAVKLQPEEFTTVAALSEVFVREGKDEEAAQVIQTYLDKDPRSKEALGRKVEPLITKDPAAAKKLLAEALE